MKLVMFEVARIQREVEIDDKLLERLSEIFCKEYNVDKSSMPDLTCLQFYNILRVKNDVVTVKKNGEECKLYPLLKEFLAKHLRMSDIFRFDPQLRIFPDTETTVLTFK